MVETMPGGQGALTLVLLTPAKKLLEVSTGEVLFPGAEGMLGILPGHVTMVCSVGFGVLRFDTADGARVFALSGGVAEVRDNKVTILADACEDASELDVGRAQKALERAQERLAQQAMGLVDVKRAQSAERRAFARIEASAVLNLMRK